MKYIDINSKLLNKQYETHMKYIQERYPRALYKAFVSAERFHDYELVEIRYFFDRALYRTKCEKVGIKIQSNILGDERYLEIVFKGITYFDLSSNADTRCELFHCDTIYCAELDITIDGLFSFEVLTSDKTKIRIIFKSATIVRSERKR